MRIAQMPAVRTPLGHGAGVLADSTVLHPGAYVSPLSRSLSSRVGKVLRRMGEPVSRGTVVRVGVGVTRSVTSADDRDDGGAQRAARVSRMPASGPPSLVVGSVASMPVTLIGAGVYDAREVTRLLALPLECVIRWSAVDGDGRPPVVAPTFDRAFAFVDLVSLAHVGELWRRRVAEEQVRAGVQFLADRTGFDKPLAQRAVVEILATSGNAFIAELDGGWFDVGRGGQGAFSDIVALYLERIEFDDLGAARSWRPAPHVLLDPHVQAGAPCIEGTRVPTSVAAAMAETDSVEAVGAELDLAPSLIAAAVEFENRLLEGRGLAA